jgi:PAS domain-containing protein
VEPELKGLRTVTATEFKRTEEDMLGYLDNAAIGLHWVDGNAMILWANPADYEPLGYTADEYIGHSITDSTPSLPSSTTSWFASSGAKPSTTTRPNSYARTARHSASSSPPVVLFDEEKNFIHTRCFTIKDPAA